MLIDQTRFNHLQTDIRHPSLLCLYRRMHPMASHNNSARSNVTTRPSKQYFCDCSRYCKSRQVQVSRPTYQRHTSFRQANMEKRLGCFRTNNHLSTAGTLQLQVTGQSNGIYRQPEPGRAMNVGTAGCGISDNTILEVQDLESEPSEVCCHPFPSSAGYKKTCRAL